MCDTIQEETRIEINKIKIALTTVEAETQVAHLSNVELVHPAPNGAKSGKQLSRHMYVQGSILVDGNKEAGVESFTVPVRGLLDTGATTRSFVEEALIDSCPSLMELVRYEKTKVILGDGDNKQAINCSGVITLNIDIIDDKGCIHAIRNTKCIIMPKLSVNVIIGLNDIVHKIPKLFIKCLVAAISEAHAGKLDAICGLCSEIKATSEKTSTTQVDPTIKVSPLDEVNESLNALNPKQKQVVRFQTAADGTTSLSEDKIPPESSLKTPSTQDITTDVITVLTLNVNGLKSSTQSGALQAYLLNQPNLHSTVIMLQETKISHAQEAVYVKLFLELGFTQVAFYSRANYGGVAILSMLEEDFTELTGMPNRDVNDEARVITAVFEHFSIVNVYKPFRNTNRLEYCQKFASDFHDHIANLIASKRRSIIITGDVNVAPDRRDETSNADPNGPGSTPDEREQHAKLLKLGLIDAWRLMNKNAIAYTTASNTADWKISKTNSKAEIVEKRLDVILVSNDVKVISSHIEASTRSFSDHSAVIATINVSRSKSSHFTSKNQKRNSAHKKLREDHARLNAVCEECDSASDSDNATQQPKRAQVTVEDVDENDDDDNDDDSNNSPWGSIEQDGDTIPAPAPWWKQRADGAKRRKAKEDLIRDIKNTIQHNEVQAFLNTLEETDIPTLKSTLMDKLWDAPAIQQMIESLCGAEDFFEPGGEGTDDTQAHLNTTSVDADEIIKKYNEGEFEPPWEIPDRSAAPEDANIGSAGLFGERWDKLQHMTLSESQQEYVSQIPRQIQEKLLEDPKWKQLLMTKGMTVWGEPVTTGITGVEPVEIHVNTEAMPVEHRAQLRPPPQQIRKEVREYIATLIGTMFERSDSSITSPMTVATKKTAPFFRLAGDYRWLNQFTLMVQSYVPVIMDELYRAKGWKYFADIDWRASFHQIPLAKRTSKIMTLMTVLGPLRPKFMMEGVNLASNVLQNIVAEIFDPLREEGIFMFDNVLMGAETTDELFTKVEKFLDICIERNVKMNFSKTWIGFNKATFFGYVLDEHGYRLDESRKKAIADIPMPGWGKTKKENTTQMKSFLGFSVYFIPFVENFAKAAAPLHDMTHMEFDWNESTWTRDYKTDFANFKSTLMSAMDLVFPDFDLEWIFLPDASQYACGWMILQLRPMPDGTLQPEPISIGSEKFSPQAVDWPINEKEAYAMVRGMKVNQGILRAKPFLVATDHWNLTFIEKDPKSKMQRYMMEMQLMPIKGCLKISGKNNPADYPSRWHVIEEKKSDAPIDQALVQSFSEREYENAIDQSRYGATDFTSLPHYLSQAETVFEQRTDADDEDDDTNADDTTAANVKHRAKTIKYSFDAQRKIFKACHGGTSGCWGIRKTYRNIMQTYPGNNLSYRIIYDWVQECAECQKRRVTLPGDIKRPIERVLGPYGPHECVSIDGAPISVPGPDENGYNGFNLTKNMGMGYIIMTPYKNKTIEEAVDALLLTRLRIGNFRIVVSDPGSDFTGKLVESFNGLIGAQHRLTHVSRPQASGIEPDIKEAKRFLTALAENQGLRHKWSTPRVLALAEFLINSDPDEDSGISPYELMHGRRDSKIFDIFKKGKDELPSDIDKYAYMQTLRQEFKLVQSIHLTCKRERAERITRRNLEQPQNRYQSGDLAFYIIDKRDKENSFQSVKMGPYEVIKQTSNDVTYKSLITGAVKTSDVTDMALFMGSKEEAYRLALTDQYQVVIISIDAWRGNPDTRTSCKFLVSFEDGTRSWQSWHSLKDTTQLEQLCAQDPRLRELSVTTQVRDRRIKNMRTMPVPVKVGDQLYIDMRWLSHTLYQFRKLKLEDKYSRRWLFPALVTAISRNRRKATVTSAVMDGQWEIDTRELQMYTYAADADIPQPHTIMDDSFMQRNAYIRQLELPQGWDSLTPDQAAKLLDPFT